MARKSIEEIAQTMFLRRTARGPILEQMLQVRERYNGDWVLPDLGGSSLPLTPTIIADAIDNNGLRAASVMPDVIAPALDNEVPLRKKRAGERRKAWLYVWEKSELNLHLRRAYRHLFGYATACLSVEPDFNYECPKIVVRDPLHALPEPKAPEDLTPPADCGFIYGKSAEWVRHHFPDAPDFVDPRRTRGGPGTGLWDIVEWIDEHDVVMGILGPRFDDDGAWYGATSNMAPVELRRYPNRAGRCTVVCPTRLTLDAIVSQVSKIIGHADLQARLMYLDIVATQKSIMPDRFILGSSAMPPRLVGGAWKPGESGEVNIVLDATNVDVMRSTPDPNNKITMDRLERNARVATGQTPVMQGEAFGGARTGRGIDSLLAAAVDPRIQEAQEMMQARLTEANRIVAECFKGYWPEKKYQVFSGWSADPEMIEFVPGPVFGETTENKVAYPLPGTDMVGLNVVIGQLVGTELISRRTARVLHPFVKDADYEETRTLVEKYGDAQTMQVLARSQDPNGGLTPIDLAAIALKIAQGMGQAEAIMEADKEARERQAREAQAAPEGMAAPPETMPGLANPGEGAEAMPPAAIPGPPSGLSNLDAMLGALSSPVPR